MELKLNRRDHAKKCTIAKIRREGDIPAVLYGKDGVSVPITISGKEFKAYLRNIQQGCLATQKFALTLEGKKLQAIIKDISYHKISYDIIHVDLMEVDADQEVLVHVPVILTGEDACLGVSQGGQIKKIKRSVKLTCKVGEIPEAFVVSVSKIPLGGAVRIKDLELTPSMRVRVNEKQILVAVSK